MGCASSMAAQTSTSRFDSDYMTYRRRTHHRPDASQFGKHIVMAIIRDKTKRKSTDGNFVQEGYVKTNSMYGPRKRTEDDFKFIEQREIDNDSPCTETTILSNDSDVTTSTVKSRGFNGKTVLVKPAPETISVGLPSVFTQNYEKKLAILRGTDTPASILPSTKTQQPEIQPDGRRQRQKIKDESPRMEIVHHISREEYIKSIQITSRPEVTVQTTSTAPPISIVHAQPTFSPKNRQNKGRTGSVVSTGQDDISENSYVVAHNTLNITWEHDYHRRAQNSSDLNESVNKTNLSIDESDEIQCLD